ncbi:MAG: dehydrogenase [Planctomycetales bacterium]|nr:dehydrogenase [Planctomycetales bacterium]
MTSKFRIALTADFYDESGTPRYADIGLDTFQGHDHINVSQFAEHRSEMTPDQLAGYNAVLVLTPKVTANSLIESKDLIAISRFGVGYDSVDVAACTENNVLLTITPGAVDRPVAEATVGWMIALTHRMFQKDQLVRTGRWDERSQYMGCELRDRTLGVVGLGGIGRKLVQLLQGLGMNQPIAYDPVASPDVFADTGVRSVELHELLSTADFVSLHCPLNDHTRGLIGVEQLAMMKNDAYLLNLARGGIVDEDALFEALSKGTIAGAALDCFENEPVTSPHRFAEFDNVILAPHSIAWTHELFRDIGRTACQSLLDVSNGTKPTGVVNPELFQKQEFIDKWRRIVGSE